MNDDKSIDLKTENTNLTNELIVLRRKYKELDEDRHYVKSLLDAEFEKGIELKKENGQLKNEIEKLSYANEDLLEEKRIWKQMSDEYTKLSYENEQLKKFESTGEHIRLSINIETGELQRHIYATGQWFGDFDRVLVKNWIDENNYQRFIDRVIEVYNNEFKKELQE